MITEELADLARRARILVAAGDFAAATVVLRHLGNLDPTTQPDDDDLVAAATVDAKALAAAPPAGRDGVPRRWARDADTAGRAYGRGHPCMLDAATVLADLLERDGRHGQAASVWADLRDIHTSRHGPNAEQAIIAGLEMAICQFHTGCCALAAETVTQILTTWQHHHPRPSTIDAMLLLHLAAMAHRCGRHHAARAHRRQADAVPLLGPGPQYTRLLTLAFELDDLDPDHHRHCQHRPPRHRRALRMRHRPRPHRTSGP